MKHREFFQKYNTLARNKTISHLKEHDIYYFISSLSPDECFICFDDYMVRAIGTQKKFMAIGSRMGVFNFLSWPIYLLGERMASQMKYLEHFWKAGLYSEKTVSLKIQKEIIARKEDIIQAQFMLEKQK